MGQCMHKHVRCMHWPVTSQADACTYNMGSKVSSLSRIYLYSSYFGSLIVLKCSFWFCWIIALPNSLLDLIGGGLAPPSQTIGSLLRTPWQVKPAGKFELPETWIRKSHNSANRVSIFWKYQPWALKNLRQKLIVKSNFGANRSHSFVSCAVSY